MAEIPLFYPNHVYQPRRYVANGHTGQLNRDEGSGGLVDPADTTFRYDETLPGSASVSELELGGKAYLLSTCAKMEDPEVLSVCLSSSSSKTVDLNSPCILELDYRQLELQPLVSVTAFVESNWIRLTLVDDSGTFVTFWLTDQLTPVDQPCQLLKPHDYIAEFAILQAVTGQEIQSSMIAFVNSTTAILALCPFLLTVDLQHAVCHMWSETQCLDDMRARTGSLRSYFTIAVTDLVLGKSNNRIMDMPPTAALCLSTALNPLLDSTYCFTLHSDASIRQWKIDTTVSPLPLEVRSLDHSKIPIPSRWSDSPNVVSLCARTYDMTFAVGVHIKTDGFVDPVDEDASVEAPSTSTDCKVFVFYGTTQQTSDSQDSCVTLTVPDEAVSLVGMSFSTTNSRCSLHALYESTNPQSDLTSTIHVVYPPSMMSIVSSEPQIMGVGSLDHVANKERSRIRSLLLGPSLLDSLHDSSVEQILHELDSWYLKYLFRPMFPRGNGTVLPPSASCIRRALAKTVRGSSTCFSGNKSKMAVGMSLELEIIRTMYEWRQRDIRQLVVSQKKKPRQNAHGSPNKSSMVLVVDGTASADATPFSLYDALAHEGENDSDDDMDMDGDDQDNWEKVEQERSDEVEGHEMRWRRLLLQIWEEEQITRTPLMVKWLSSQPLQVTVRSGLTTVTELPKLTQQKITPSWEGTLDHFALTMLGRIESDKTQSARLYAVELHVSISISKAHLALQPPGDVFIDDLTALSQWATAGNEGIADADHDLLENIVSNLSPSQLVQWIQSTPSNSTGELPGLEIIDMDDTRSKKSGVTWSQRQVANHQLRHSASTLALRCFDSVRRLQLSRSLLLLVVGEGSQARDAALRAYLYTIAVLWTSSQRIPMPLTTFQSRKPVRLDDAFESSSPPSKRLSFGDDATSILAPSTFTMTTTIDAVAIEASQTMDLNCVVPVSPIGIATFLARYLFRQAFSARWSVPIDKPSLLPELGVLPRPKDDSIATDHPRLALRLLAPYVAYPLAEDSADVVLARKESLAECLLIESHASSAPESTKSQMRQIACEMLVPNSPRLDSPTIQASIRSTFDYLESLRNGAPSAPVSKEMLMNTVQRLIPTGTSIEIRRLCELETVKALFSPLVVSVGAGREVDERVGLALSTFAEIMLHLSKIMYRLTILERHVSRRDANEEGENPDVVIGFISSAISDMAKTFPDEVCRAMPEYGKMWSRLFNHSILAGEWKTAYSACVRNPRSELRSSSFQRLIRAMVDQGSLNDLLLLCTELGQRIAQPSTMSATEMRATVDLYELASDVLAENTSRDVYSIRASSPDPSTLSDYQGALYALHASQKQWRRAAQSMDMRFVNARKAVVSGANSSYVELRSSEVRDGLIAEDLVLASVSALNAIELIKNDAHKFLVSGESGQYNKIPVDVFGGESPHAAASSKRSRGPTWLGEEKSADNDDRLSNFMTNVELCGRAIRSISLRALYFDRAVDPSIVKSAFLHQIDASKPDIDKLFHHGYFHYGLLLSMAWTRNREADTGSRRPEGSDLFFDCLLHMLECYLIPTALTGTQDSPRPSLEQLHSGLDSINIVGGVASYVAAERYSSVGRLETRALKEASMTLVRNLTVSFTQPDAPVALEVASMFLDSGSPVIPAWLEHFIMGSGAPSPNGLFAPRPRQDANGYLGNPAGLLTLYTKHGLLAEACMVVSSTLTAVDSQGKTREEKAPSRLPERGDIDFVPYKAIDTLWNLSDVVLSKGVLQSSEQERLEKARVTMKEALDKHFGLATISEAGIRSSRALRS